ncbi:hypothetical protein RA280_19595 [Cupriavidus sp. CV2]|uniref:hypothetical protein n=1 Tax=Cupriavidus ulmosensis TaxID=3065913 RepID=UPI00296AF840|nr:hypothetical protein [Cupriavidus sp. CV2]MDW3683907.1 hypothetical protein [Cupriavidus sp. CV2]
MTTTVTITHNGASLQVSGTYFRGYVASLEEPGAPDTFEVDTVTDSGVDVMHLHDDAALDEIAALALDAYFGHQAHQRHEAAKHRRAVDAFWNSSEVAA